MNIDYQRVMTGLRDTPIGHTIIHHTTLSSTMTAARCLAIDHKIHSGTIVLAEEQTAGRGRLQREWVTPIGKALLMTVILKPAFPFHSQHYLPMIAGIALTDALEATVPVLCGQVALKWPNDVLLGDISSDRQKKVAGLLIETVHQPSDDGTFSYVLLGIGLNVNQTSEELPIVPVGKPQPTSIHLSAGHLIDREMLLKNLCEHIGRWLIDPFADDQKCQLIYQTWRDRLCTLGQTVTCRLGDQKDARSYTGVAIDINPTGALVIQDIDGQCHTFAAGDVTLHKYV